MKNLLSAIFSRSLRVSVLIFIRFNSWRNRHYKFSIFKLLEITKHGNMRLAPLTLRHEKSYNGSVLSKQDRITQCFFTCISSLPIKILMRKLGEEYIIIAPSCICALGQPIAMSHALRMHPDWESRSYWSNL